MPPRPTLRACQAMLKEATALSERLHSAHLQVCTDRSKILKDYQNALANLDAERELTNYLKEQVALRERTETSVRAQVKELEAKLAASVGRCDAENTRVRMISERAERLEQRLRSAAHAIELQDLTRTLILDHLIQTGLVKRTDVATEVNTGG